MILRFGFGFVLAAFPLVAQPPGNLADPTLPASLSGSRDIEEMLVRPPWVLSAGALTYRVSQLNGWGFGPAAGAQRRLHGSLALDLNAGVLLTSSGFYDFSGITLDVGPSLVHFGEGLDLGVGLGLSTVVGGDSDGTGGGWAGGYLSGQGTAWLSYRVGITVRGALRLVSTGRTSPSISVALAFSP